MWIVGIGLLILFEAIADIFSKEYSFQGSALFWTLALSGYIVANIFWLYSIRAGSGLERGAILFSIGSALVAVCIGYFKYGERVGKIETAGFALGLVAIVLIFWPDLINIIRR